SCKIRDDTYHAAGVHFNFYRVEGAMPGQELIAELHYEGVVNYAVRQSGGEYAGAFSQSPGLIESRGVYLAGSTHRVPRVGDSGAIIEANVEGGDAMGQPAERDQIDAGGGDGRCHRWRDPARRFRA